MRLMQIIRTGSSGGGLIAQSVTTANCWLGESRSIPSSLPWVDRPREVSLRQLAIVPILNATLLDPAHDVKFTWALLAVIIGLITPVSAIRDITNSITNGITNGITNEAQILVT
ncbi:unnamed protein product [Clonostachys rhizophaga]|uniref:Uncharacterized protein n=1 Tax=Clonostachys rhizophaga TaxID=160324 RepID=A0A9N9VGA5_9HYPO|nr:unnamed protein product [Clonostachys rhizophaga]